MTKLLAVALLAIPLVGFSADTAPSGTQSQPGTTGQEASTTQMEQQKNMASVTFVNSIPESQSVNVIAQGQPIFQNVAFGKSSQAKQLPAKDMKIDIVSSDGKQVFAENHDLSLSADKNFTVVATGTMTGEGKRQVHTEIISANRKDLSADKTHIALVNGAPKGQELTLRVDGKNVISGLNSMKSDTTSKITPGSHRLEIASGDRGIVAGPMQVNFSGGKAYTIVASQQMLGGAAPEAATGGMREQPAKGEKEGAKQPSMGQLQVQIFDDQGQMVSGSGQGAQQQGQTEKQTEQQRSQPPGTQTR